MHRIQKIGRLLNECLRLLSHLLTESDCPLGICDGVCNAEYPRRLCDKCCSEILLDRPARTDCQPIHQVYSAAGYISHAKKLVLYNKRYSPRLAPHIAEIMHQCYLQSAMTDIQFDYIVPVPGLLSRQRNWVPSSELAEHLSQLLGVPCLDALTKRNETNIHGLTRTERTQLVGSSFVLGETGDSHRLTAAPQKILLVDDLIASGTTLRTCADACLSSRTDHQIYAITFCSSRA